MHVFGLCALCLCVYGSLGQEVEKYQLLKDVLHELSNDVPGVQYEPAVDDYEWEEPVWEEEVYKRGPPSGFSAVRGKRQSEDKRVPSNKEFFGARGKKDSLPGKRLPSNNEFYSMRGKKSDGKKRMFWARWRGSQPWIKEGVKRVPQSGMFYSARGKKNSAQDLDQNKRVLANHFFGARGKKSGEFSVEAIDNSPEKRLSSGQFFGARGKKSNELDKRFSNSDFFGARGKKNEVYLDEANNKRLSQNEFFGARGKRSTAYGLGSLRNDLSLFPAEDIDSSVIQ